MRQGAVLVRHNPYRYSPKETEFLDKEIAMLEKIGCIERSNVGHANYNG